MSNANNAVNLEITMAGRKKSVYVCFVIVNDYGEEYRRGPIEFCCDTLRKARRWQTKRQKDCDEADNDDYEEAKYSKIEVN